MADGHVKLEVELDESGAVIGLKKVEEKAKNSFEGLGTFAKKGFSVVKDAASAVTEVSVKAIAAASAAIGAGIGASIKVGAEFEAEMSKVSAISGATGEELDQLSEKAKQMGADTKFGATEAAQAMEYMAMAGWKTADMLDGIEGIMNLAAASGEDLASTSDIVTDALTAFNMTAEESTHFADVLAQAAVNANTNVGMMGETFKYVAPVAGALGYSAEDTAVAIGLMANRSIKASQAGTSLRQIITRLIKPTGEAETAVDALGISVTNTDGSMKPLSQTISELREKFSKLTEAEKAEYAAMLAGQEGMSALLAITESTDKQVEQLTESIENCDGAAKTIAETMNENLKGAMEEVSGAAETLRLEIYDSIKDSLKGMAQSAGEAIDGLTEAFKSGGTEGLIQEGTRLAAELATGIANAAPKMIEAASSIITSFTENLSANLPELLVAGSSLISSLLEGIFSMGEALWGLGTELCAQIYNSLMENLPQMMDSGAQIVTNLIYGISEMLPTLVENGLALILQFALGIVENLPMLITAGIEMLLSLAQGVINSIPLLIEQVPQIINTFAEAVYAAIPQLIFAGIELIGNLCKGIINSIPTVIANAGEITAAIFNTISLLNLFTAGKGIIKGLGDGMKSLFASIKASVKNLIELIKNPFKFDWSSLGRNIIDGIVNGIKSTAKKLAEAALSAVKSAINAAKNFLGIHSPSRLARDILGKNLIAGIGVGVEEETPHLEQLSEHSMENVVHAMQEKTYSVYPEYRIAETKEDDNDNQEDKDPFDYPKFASILKDVLDGMGISVDDREFARLVWEVS